MAFEVAQMPASLHVLFQRWHDRVKRRVETTLVSLIPSKKMEQVWAGFKESHNIKGMCMKLGIQFGLKEKIGKEMCKAEKVKQIANAESRMCYKEQWTTADFKNMKNKSSDLVKR